MKNIFYRAAGILLSSSLVFTGLNFIGNSKAFAEYEPSVPQNNISEENHYDEWSVKLIDKNFLNFDSESPALFWSLKSPVEWKQNSIYLIDLSNNNSVVYYEKMEENYQTYESNINLPASDSSNYNYQLIIAEDNPTAQHLTDLNNIKSKSNVLQNEENLWEISSSVLLSFPHYLDPSLRDITFFVKLQKSPVNREDYAVFVVNDFTKEVMYKSIIADNRDLYGRILYVDKNIPEEYTVYIADKELNAKNLYELTNVVAGSNSNIDVSQINYTRDSEKFHGGFNESSVDCQQQCYGDPINSYTGEYFESSNDLIVNSIPSISIVRSYSTFQKDNYGPFGLGSNINFGMKIKGNLASLDHSELFEIHQENGSKVHFKKQNNGNEINFVTSYENQSTTLNKINNEYVMSRKTGEKFFFNSNGILVKTSDMYNNETRLVYENDKLIKLENDDNKYIQLNYNTDNLISYITDGTSTVNYEYDVQKRLVNVKSYEFANPKEYKYDSQNRVSEITQTNGGTYKNTYDTNNRVIKQIDPLNNETQFEYDEYSDRYETITTLPDDTFKLDTYDLYGNLISEVFNYTGTEDLKYKYEYASSGQISRTEDSSGNVTNYMYDENGNISVIIDDLGRSTRFAYNEFNQVIEKINPYSEKITNNYNDRGMLESVKDANNNITKYKTDDKGRLTEIIQPEQVGKTSPKSEKIIYDANGFVSQNISPEGGIQKITNNSLGLPIKFTDPYNNDTIVSYNSQLKISKRTYPDGTFEEYKYDNASRLTKHIDILGNETNYTYDLMDNIVSSTNSFGTTTYKYDSSQHLTEVVEPNSAKTLYKYDLFGRLIETENADGNVSTLTYDDAGNVNSETDFNGNLTEYEYDSLNNLVYATDSNGEKTEYTYDRLNRLTNFESPNGYTEEYEYDSVGNLINLNKNNVDFKSYSYDKNNNLIKIKYKDSSTVENTYNANNSLISFKNRDDKTVSYKYDLNERLIEKTRPDSTKESIKYTSMGDVSQISYDNWVTIDTEYEYNATGQLTKATTNNNETTYAYDATGQLTSRGPPSAQVGYTYDNLGRLNTIDYPTGTTVQYSYNLLNNIDTVKIGEEVIVDYTYDDNGNVINERYGNNVERNNVFDNLNRLTDLSFQKDANSLYNRSLTYDETYLVQTANASVNDIEVEDKEFTYSKLEKLEEIYNHKSDNTEEYTIDNYSNLLESPLSKNKITKNGQLTSSLSKDSYTSYFYDYDERGNRLSKTDEYDEKNINYTWTDNNKLENLITNSYDEDNNEVLEFSLGYTYDASGLLQSRSTNNSKTDDYVWDTTSSVPLLLEDGKNSYIYGNDSTPVAQINKTSGAITYLHGDERGSIVLATNSNGNSLLTREYDAYGNHVENAVISPSNPATNPFTTNFAYAGEYQDKDSGLYNLRARWYEPLTGTFINQDPALMATGEAYSYASGNPLSFTDPLGLYSTAITPSDSAGGNIAAGFVDGLIGYPVVHKISNYIKPGSVSNCGPGYKVSGYAGMATGFLIPGGAAVKGIGLVAKSSSKIPGLISKFGKYAKDRSKSDIASVPIRNSHTIDLYYKEGWTPYQISEANRKVDALNNLAKDGKLIVTKPPTRIGNNKKRYEDGTGDKVLPTENVDHIWDLQLGGSDTVNNMWRLDESVNKSLGPQIWVRTVGKTGKANGIRYGDSISRININYRN